MRRFRFSGGFAASASRSSRGRSECCGGFCRFSDAAPSPPSADSRPTVAGSNAGPSAAAEADIPIARNSRPSSSRNGQSHAKKNSAKAVRVEEAAQEEMETNEEDEPMIVEETEDVNMHEVRERTTMRASF